MEQPVMTWADHGLTIVDIRTDAAFASRKLHLRGTLSQMEGLQRITRAFLGSTDSILQELVLAAVDLCGADSAGISLEIEGGTDQQFYHWVATAGDYSGFLDAVLPRYPSACGVCLERGRPQSFTVGRRFFDIMGVEAPPVTDGLLLPWEVDGIRGTIFVMAHHREQAFDSEDAKMMELLADFAASGVKQQRQQKALLEQTKLAAAAAMANDLAHNINNPLQGLTNRLFLAAGGHDGQQAVALGQETMQDLERLSDLVRKLLALPFAQPATTTSSK